MQPQDFTVTKAFISKNRETQVIDEIPTQGGPMHKFIFQLAEHPGVWFNTLKKPGNELKEGDKVYGTVGENNYGKLAFVKASRPQGQGYPAAQAPRPQQAAPQGAVTLQMVYNELKLVRGLLENQFQPAQATYTQAPGGDTVVTDFDNGPVDLSEIPY